MEKHTSISFKAKVKPIKPINKEFSLVKVYVQGVGKNRNGSYMSKENIEKYLPTLNYCPVVGHLIEYTDNEGNKHRFIGGHDWTITEDWEIKDLTVPYGVVVENSFDFETINEYGTDVEYLTANAILWTGRYPELYDAIYSEDIWFNQSMEINVEQFRPLDQDSNYTELLEWSYSALCMLGKADEDSTNGHTDPREHTEPCFISSKIVPIEFSKSEFSELMNEMKEKIAFCLNQSSTMEVDIDKNNGGSTMTDEIKNEVVDEMAETVVEETVDETVEEVVEEVVETVEETADENFEETTEETVETEVEEVTEEVVEETTEETDEEVIEETNEDFSAMYAELKEKYDALEKEFSDYKAEHSYFNADYEALAQFKADKEAEERHSAEEALFADYEETIGGTEEFKSLKEKSAEFSLDALKKECLCIVGMYSMTSKAKETKKPKESLKFSVENPETENDPYGGIHAKYLNR